MRPQKTTLYITCDHGGYKLKKNLWDSLAAQYRLIDLNPVYQADDDYPKNAAALARILKSHPQAKGLAICRSGVGMCIVANKFPGIRAVASDQLNIVRRSRQDEDTNILCLGADYINTNQSQRLIWVFLTTPFKSIPRYKRRLGEIKSYER
jgi:ribose 5-phosphate isomerase B